MNTLSLSSRHAKAGTVIAIGPLPFTLQLLAAAILDCFGGQRHHRFGCRHYNHHPVQPECRDQLAEFQYWNR